MGNVPLLGAAVTLKASGAQTASTTGSDIAVSAPAGPVGAGFWLVTVTITAASGTNPTMLVAIDGGGSPYYLSGPYFELATIGADSVKAWGLGILPAPLTTTGTFAALVSAMAPVLRYRSTIGGGTPSFTYSVSAQYSTNPDHA